MDYVNAPVGGGRRPPAARCCRWSPCRPRPAPAARARRSACSTSSSQHVKTGISHARLRPTLAVVDPELTLTQPAGVTAASGLDILCHALESYTARPFDSYERKHAEERVPYCGANPIADMWSEKALACWPRRSAPRCATATTSEARTEMAMAATFAGLGFGNAGVHIPHANAYPIAGRVRDFRPAGYAGDRRDGPARHGRLADGAGGVPVHLRGRARSGTCARPSCSRPTPTRPDDPGEFLPQVLAELMRDVGIPPGIGAVGFGEGDVDSLVEGTLKQQRLLATAPREVAEDDVAAILAPVDRALVTLETVRRPSSASSSAGVTDVDDSTLARALYSTDASLYRVVPQVVVRPRSVEEVLATVEACRETGTPLTSRGAGTSIAGNAVGTGVVIDLTRHLNRVHDDRRRGPHRPRRARHRARRAAEGRDAARAALRSRSVDAHALHVGGMIGNNACGSRALAYGRTADNVVGLDLVTMAGEQLTLDAAARTVGDARRPAALVGANLATIRTEFGRFGRQVSGYSLEHLLPENGFDVATLHGRHRGHARDVTGRHRPAGRGPGRTGSSCSATPRWPRPPTTSRRCRSDPPPARGSTPASSTSSAHRGAPCPTCRAAQAGCSSRSPATAARSARSPDAVVARRRRGRPPGRDRRRRAGRAVAHPRGGRRPRDPHPARQGPLRLGGRRRPARAARHLPARARRPAPRRRARRRAVRALRRRLRAHPHRLPARRRAGTRCSAPSSSTPRPVAALGGSLSGEHGDGRARSELLP